MGRPFPSFLYITKCSEGRSAVIDTKLATIHILRYRAISRKQKPAQQGYFSVLLVHSHSRQQYLAITCHPPIGVLTWVLGCGVEMPKAFFLGSGGL